MRKAYINKLYELALENKDIIALISDNGAIVYDKYREDLGPQFLNFGISEANMIAAAAGMSQCGLIPFAYTISTFLTMRAFEFIRNDVCLNKANVKLVGTGPGFIYGELGPTHHATEDIAIMRVLPYMTVISPASPKETEKAVVAASEIDGPVYLRIGTGNNPEIYENDSPFIFGKGITLKEGTDLTIISTGTILNEALKAHMILRQKGILARVINIHTIKPIDEEIILKAAVETKNIITLEEHNVIGGLGDAVADVILKNNCNIKNFRKIGLDNCFTKGYGTYDYLKDANGLNAQAIVSAMEDLKIFKKRGLFP